MTFTGNEDHSIDLDTAKAWTKNYRDANPGTPANPTILAHYFGKAAILELLAQTDCVGMRIYYALKPDATKQLVLVGVDADGNDLYQGLLKERSIVCPPDCGNAASPLRG